MGSSWEPRFICRAEVRTCRILLAVSSWSQQSHTGSTCTRNSHFPHFSRRTRILEYITGPIKAHVALLRGNCSRAQVAPPASETHKLRSVFHDMTNERHLFGVADVTQAKAGKPRQPLQRLLHLRRKGERHLVPVAEGVRARHDGFHQPSRVVHFADAPQSIHHLYAS